MAENSHEYILNIYTEDKTINQTYTFSNTIHMNYQNGVDLFDMGPSSLTEDPSIVSRLYIDQNINTQEELDNVQNIVTLIRSSLQAVEETDEQLLIDFSVFFQTNNTKISVIKNNKIQYCNFRIENAETEFHYTIIFDLEA